MMRKILSIALLIAATGIISCKSSKNNTDESNADSTNMSAGAPADSSAHKAVYTCPMHPEVVSDTAAKCPKCGMDLEIKT